LKKLAIITTHPIQYNGPFFSYLASTGSLIIKVFYTWGQSESGNINDPDFNLNRKWDIDLLKGYDFCFVDNKAKRPGSNHFLGIDNPTLINKIEMFGPDALLVYGWCFKSHLGAIRYFKDRLPVIFRGDSNLLDSSNENLFFVKSFLRRQFLTWVYSHIDYALYVGKSNFDYYIKMGLVNDQLFYGPHAIDNDRFSSISDTQKIELDNWKLALGINIDDFVFLFVGKFESKKNPLLLINAFKKLCHQSIKLVFVGDGILINNIKAAADSDSRIICLGFQNQSIMPIVYRLGNVFVLPSKGPYETWGLAMNEAMASGLPIIASDCCGGAIDLITPETGLIFKSDNLTALHDTMLYYIENPTIAISNGINAKAMIMNFNYATTFKSLDFLIKTN